MPNRRDFLRTVAAGAAGTYVMGRGGLSAAAAALQAERARRQVMVGGRRVRVIDVHAHCVIPVEDIVKGTPLASMGGGGGNNILGPQRLQLMDQQGVDVQALSINGYWWYAADRDLARRIVRAQNEGLAKWVATHPDRFVALASVALQHPDLAAEQLEDGVKRLGLRGASIGGHVNGEDLSLPKYDPFWAKAAELGVLVFMHPGGAENIIKEGALARARRSRQHHRQSARDDLLPVAPDLRRDAGQVPRPPRLRRARRRLPAVLSRTDRSGVRRARQRELRQQEESRASI